LRLWGNDATIGGVLIVLCSAIGVKIDG
jgi:hypothetical protein